MEANSDVPAIATENLPELGQLDRIPPSTSLPAPSRPKSGAVTGGSIGSAIAVFAQTLRDPYKTWAVMLAPFNRRRYHGCMAARTVVVI